MSYADLLRDPRWQRKRLEVMQRDDFACIACGERERTLNVHHIEYRTGYAPWEYPASELHTLCEDCHADEHGKGPKAMRAVQRAAEEQSHRERRERIRQEKPEEARLMDRMDEIDARMPVADSAEKDTLTVEKMDLMRELRRLGARRFKGLRS